MDRRAFLASAVLTAAGAAAGCGAPPPLANTHPTPEVLARAVLAALERRNRQALEALALDEREFRDHIWPDLPAARPERNLPFSYVWGDLHQKSRLALGDTLARYGGVQHGLIAVTFSRTTRYARYAVHHDTRLRVRTTAGTEADLRVCGSMVNQDGAWKVFSYVVDN